MRPVTNKWLYWKTNRARPPAVFLVVHWILGRARLHSIGGLTLNAPYSVKALLPKLCSASCADTLYNGASVLNPARTAKLFYRIVRYILSVQGSDESRAVFMVTNVTAHICVCLRYEGCLMHGKGKAAMVKPATSLRERCQVIKTIMRPSKPQSRNHRRCMTVRG